MEGHSDAIMDCAYNFHGTRLATCAADRRIIVWNQNADGQWTQSCAPLERHTSAVYKVDWAHPEFGQVIASCSADRTVIVWEETQNRSRKRQWVSRATLSDSRCPVVDVQFAPRHQGLKLAAASEDGCVRMYEAVDVMDLDSWQLAGEEQTIHAPGVTCVAWNPCLFDPPELVVGTGQADQPMVKIWRYNSDERAWRPTLELAHDGGPGAGAVRCVDWAPKMGRSSHYIATAQGEHVRIWELEDTGRQGKEAWKHELAPGATSNAANDAAAGATAATTSAAPAAEVWRVKWNVTGSVLASSGDDGKVRLWKPDPISGNWIERAEIVSGSGGGAAATGHISMDGDEMR